MFIPKSLRPGDLLLIVSPSFAPDPGELEAGMEYLKRSGFQVEGAPNLGKVFGSFAGSDEERLADLQWALDHPKAKMIICSRGGYGCTRIFRGLDFSGFRKNPKWLVGFSDITVLHLLLQARGFASLHGPMVADFSRLSQLPACIKQQDLLLNSHKIQYRLSGSGTGSDPEKISGLLSGGNLSLVDYMIPELDEDFWAGRLLFLEEVGEAFHKIDRMIDRIFRSGKLSGIQGVVLGSFRDCPQKDFPLTPREMIRARVSESLPILEGLPCGHSEPSMPLLLGYPTELEHIGPDWVLKQQALPLISVAA